MKQYWIIRLHDGLEPEHYGPMDTTEQVLDAAREIHAVMGDNDVLIGAEVKYGDFRMEPELSTWAFGNFVFDPN